jgi:hypothetical protein
MRFSKVGLLSVAAIVTLASCASLKIENVDFGWPVESVISVGDDNVAQDKRYSIAFPTAALALEEFQNADGLKGARLRVLRNTEGYYFVTGPKFKNVYVFAPGEGMLCQEEKIPVSETGLVDPALNNRPPHVELVDGESLKKLLTSGGVAEGNQP